MEKKCAFQNHLIQPPHKVKKPLVMFRTQRTGRTNFLSILLSLGLHLS